MKGLREILVSFTIGLAVFAALSGTRQYLDKQKRYQTPSEPIASQANEEDPALAVNWGIKAIGAQHVWPRHKGNRDVLVAVIDTGCDIHHPDLRENIWQNPGEAGGKIGIDDDDNGFVDDFHGWNFIENSSDVEDEHGHGTHIAGIIGAGSGGVSPRVSLMILKYYDSKSTGAENVQYTVAAIRYAVRMGADIINYSGGGILRNEEEEEALRWAAVHGVLIVAAAGNEGMNSDFFHFYPADYDLPNIISVGAVDRFGNLTDVSNYGSQTVDVAAPGKNIYSTLPGGLHGYLSGTSQATAFVTGLAALLIASNPEMTNPEVLIQHLVDTGNARTVLKNKIRSGGLLDAVKTLEESDWKLTQVSRNRSPARIKAN